MPRGEKQFRPCQTRRFSGLSVLSGDAFGLSHDLDHLVLRTKYRKPYEFLDSASVRNGPCRITPAGKRPSSGRKPSGSSNQKSRRAPLLYVMVSVVVAS